MFIPFGPNLTLRELQELIRDQKVPGFLVFDKTTIDTLGEGATSPMNGTIDDFHGLEIFMDNIYFVLTNEASPKIGTIKNKKH